MSRLDGKRILVTAAAQGIGKASVLAMVNEGADVVATDVNDDALQSLKNQLSKDQKAKSQQGSIDTMALDVTNKIAIEQAAQHIGRVDVLFNCAGFVHHGSVLDATEDEWDFAFDLNAKAMFRMIRAFLPDMVSHGSGSIINMASVASSVTGVPVRCIYGASKSAVIGLTKSVAADFVTNGIRCNAICPGTVQSPSLEDRMRAQGGDYDAVRGAFIDRQPMGRLGKPEEIAALVVYLASDDSAYTTGQIHVIDGGLSL